MTHEIAHMCPTVCKDTLISLSLCLSVSVDFQVRVMCVCLVYCLSCVLCIHDVVKAVLVTSSSKMPSGAWRRSVSMVCWWWAAPGWCCLAAPSVVQIPVPFLIWSCHIGRLVLLQNRGSCSANPLRHCVPLSVLPPAHLVTLCMNPVIVVPSFFSVTCKISFLFPFKIKWYLVLQKMESCFFHPC